MMRSIRKVHRTARTVSASLCAEAVGLNPLLRHGGAGLILILALGLNSPAHSFEYLDRLGLGETVADFVLDPPSGTAYLSVANIESGFIARIDISTLEVQAQHPFGSPFQISEVLLLRIPTVNESF